MAPLNDAFHSVDDQQPARPTAGLAVDPSLTLGPPTPQPAAPAAPADAWHSVPGQAPVAPQPDATPGWIMPRSKLFPEDADYLAGREQYVDQMAANKYGSAVLGGPPDQVAKLQQWADAVHPHDYTAGEAFSHPLNYLNSNTPLTPQLAWEYLKTQTPPDAIANARHEFYGGYDTHRYLELRDQMANKLADAYVASEMGKQAATDATSDPNPTRFPDAVHGYVNQALAGQGWMIGQGLPPVALEKFPRATGIDPTSNAVGRTNAVGRGLNSITWQPGYNVISLGLHGVGAVAPDSGIGRAANDYADRMNAGQAEITGALPSSAEATAHPFGVEGLLEKGIELTPQLTGMGAVGKMGKLGHVLNTATIFGQAGNAAYDEIYNSAKQNGEADDVARQKAGAGAVAVGAVNAWLMRFGAVPKWAEADPGFRNRMVHILMSGISQAGVAGASDATDQLANYALTGKSPDGQRLIENAATMALAGAATGVLSPTRKPGQTPPERGPAPLGEYPRKPDDVVQLPEQPPAAPPAPAAEQPPGPPANLKEAQQRRQKRQLEQPPPENIKPKAGAPHPDLQVTTTDLARPAEQPVAAPAQPAEAPKPAAPTQAQATPAKPAFDPERPLANLEDASGKMIVRGPEQIGWIQETYKRFPDPSKWEEAIRSGKLQPPPAFTETPPAKPAIRPKPAEPPHPVDQMAEDALRRAKSAEPAGTSGAVDAVASQSAAHGEEIEGAGPAPSETQIGTAPAEPDISTPEGKQQATIAYYEDLADALGDSKDPWERSGSARLKALAEMARSKRRPDPDVIGEIVQQYARNDAQRGTDLGKAVRALSNQLLQRVATEPPSPPKPDDPHAAARAVVPDLNPLPPMSAEQKEAVAVGKKLGVDVQFYGSQREHGSFVAPEQPDRLYVHTQTRGVGGIREAVGHEAAHSLARTDPELLDRTLRAIDPKELSEKSRKYLERYKAAYGDAAAADYASKPGRLDEEGIATIMGEAAMKDRVWRSMAGKEPNVAQAVGDKLAAILDRVKGSGDRVNAAIKMFREAREGAGQRTAEPPKNLKEAKAAVAAEPTGPDKSKGHVEFVGKNEYFRAPGGDLMRAPIDAPVMPDGYRSGRFESTPVAAEQSLKLAREASAKPEAPPPARVEGRTADIDTASGKVKAHYAAVEADSVVPSHDEFTFQPNKAHAGGQERQYDTDVNEQQKVKLNTQNFDSRHVLSDDPTPASGPPMIYDDGSAIGGNNRAMIQRRVYSDPRKSGKLKADVVAAADKFGLDPQAVAKLDKPMIVRVLGDQPREPGKLAELSRKLQKGLTQEMSTGADAASRAKILMQDPRGLDTISKLLASEDKSVRDILGEPAKARQLAHALIDSGAINQTELSKFTTEYGGFTDDGKKLVENMLLHTAVSKPAALDGVPHNVVQKLTSNLAEFGFTGAKPDWSLAKDMTQALEGYQRWRERAGGQPVDEWLNGKEQMSLVPDPITQPGMERPRRLLESLVNDKAADFKSRIRSYANEARSSLPGQEHMFSGSSEPTPDEAFDRAFGGKPPKSSDALFLPAPGQRFYEDDVKPTAEAIRDAFVEAGDDVVSTLAPQTRSRAFGERVREHNAELARRIDVAATAMETARRYFRGKTISDIHGEALDFIDRIERGRRQSNPALQPFADTMRRVMDQGLKDVQGMGKGALTKFIKNYFPHLWADVPKAAGLYAKRPFEGTKDFLRKRKIPTIREGIELHGLEPKFENPVDMILARYREMEKFVLAHKLLDEMRAKGTARFVDARTKPPLGWAKINDPIGTVYGRPTGKGEVRIRGYWIAVAGDANVLNNHLSPGIRERSGLVRGAMTANNVLNMAQLGVSAFHGLATTIHGSVADMGLGLKQLADGEVGKGLTSVGKSLTLAVPVLENLSLGSKVIHEWNKPGSISDPRARLVADAMVAAGARANRNPIYQTKFADRMMEAFAKGNIVGGVWRAPFAGLEALAHPIMEKFVPAMKVGLFAKLAMYELDKLGPGASREDVRKALAPAWDHVENILGELTYDNLFWHRVAKDVTMLTTRSVGWNLGTLRGGAGGVLDLAGNVRDVARGKPTELSHRSAYLIALPAFTAVLGGVVHRLLTGENPEEPKDYYYPKTGEKDARGHDIRISLPTYVKDYVAWYRHPGQTAINKASPVLHALGEMIQNKDFYGVKIRNEGDNPARQALDVAKYAGQQMTPFSARDAGKIGERGLNTKSALPLIGITPAPKDLDLSPAEQKARELEVAQMPPGGRTSEAVARTQAKYDLAQKVRSREPGAYGAIRQALKDRTIKPGDEKDVIDIAKKDPLIRSVEGLGLDDAMQVFDLATDDEKRKLLLPLSRKLANSRKETPEDKKTIRSKLIGERDRLRKPAA